MTNAAKYGALASKGGRIDVTCGVDGESVAVRWQENGGPPVAKPTAYGFGSRLVTRTLSAISGRIKPDFLPSGLTCEITFTRT